MVDLFQSPGGRVQAAPGVATGGEPRPPVADILEAAGGQQAPLQFVAVGGAFGLVDDPVRARHDARGRAPQPGLIPREAVVLAQHPENPAVMLVVAARFEAARAIKDALLGREIPGQRHRALVMQPGVQALLRLLVIAAAVEVHHHHAGFVAVGAVAERADAGKTPLGAVGIAFAIDEQVAGMGAVELVEHRLRRDEPRAFVQPPAPIAGDLALLLVEVQLRQRRLLGLLGQHEVGDLDDDGLAFARRKRPGPIQGLRLNGRRFVGQHLPAHIVAEPEQSFVVQPKRFDDVSAPVSQRQRRGLRRAGDIGEDKLRQEHCERVCRGNRAVRFAPLSSVAKAV